MAPAPKRHDPAKRDRFNMREKEPVAVAVEAEIETVGHTVNFPCISGRIGALMPWPRRQADALVLRLKRFRPNGCALTVNGEPVPERPPEIVRAATLTTVVHHRQTGALRHSPRKTEIHLLLPPAGDQCWLYEMGLTIQPIAAQWDIDVRRKNCPGTTPSPPGPSSRPPTAG